MANTVRPPPRPVGVSPEPSPRADAPSPPVAAPHADLVTSRQPPALLRQQSEPVERRAAATPATAPSVGRQHSDVAQVPRASPPPRQVNTATSGSLPTLLQNKVDDIDRYQAELAKQRATLAEILTRAVELNQRKVALAREEQTLAEQARPHLDELRGHGT